MQGVIHLRQIGVTLALSPGRTEETVDIGIALLDPRDQWDDERAAQIAWGRALSLSVGRQGAQILRASLHQHDYIWLRSVLQGLDLHLHLEENPLMPNPELTRLGVYEILHAVHIPLPKKAHRRLRLIDGYHHAIRSVMARTVQVEVRATATEIMSAVADL